MPSCDLHAASGLRVRADHRELSRREAREVRLYVVVKSGLATGALQKLVLLLLPLRVEERDPVIHVVDGEKKDVGLPGLGSQRETAEGENEVE